MKTAQAVVLSCLVGLLLAAWSGQSRAAEPEQGEVVRERYPDGAVRVERHVIQKDDGSYVNHGPWTAYYPDGKKVGGGEMKLGKRHGLWKRWYAPGEGALFRSPLYREYEPPFVSTAEYAGGEIDGAWIIEDQRKTKISQWHFKQGKPHGIWTWWYPSGQKRREAVYVDGTLDGTVTEWYPDGRISSREEYLQGRKKANDVAYYRPQVKRWQGWWLEPKEYTKTTYDWWAGEASTEVVGQRGKREKHGKWIYWYPNGQKQFEGKYVRGKRDGRWTWWFENGQKWIAGDYVLGKQSGPWTWWTPTGAVEKKNEFPVIERPKPTVAAGAKPGESSADAKSNPNDKPAKKSVVAPPASKPGSESATPKAAPAPSVDSEKSAKKSAASDGKSDDTDEDELEIIAGPDGVKSPQDHKARDDKAANGEAPSPQAE